MTFVRLALSAAATITLSALGAERAEVRWGRSRHGATHLTLPRQARVPPSPLCPSTSSGGGEGKMGGSVR
jgi:hypothetical protein